MDAVRDEPDLAGRSAVPHEDPEGIAPELGGDRFRGGLQRGRQPIHVRFRERRRVERRDLTPGLSFLRRCVLGPGGGCLGIASAVLGQPSLAPRHGRERPRDRSDHERHAGPERDRRRDRLHRRGGGHPDLGQQLADEERGGSECGARQAPSRRPLERHQVPDHPDGIRRTIRREPNEADDDECIVSCAPSALRAAPEIATFPTVRPTTSATPRGSTNVGSLARSRIANPTWTAPNAATIHRSTTRRCSRRRASSSLRTVPIPGSPGRYTRWSSGSNTATSHPLCSTR